MFIVMESMFLSFYRCIFWSYIILPPSFCLFSLYFYVLSLSFCHSFDNNRFVWAEYDSFARVKPLANEELVDFHSFRNV